MSLKTWLQSIGGIEGEGPRPTYCGCGAELASRIREGRADHRTSVRRTWEELYCPNKCGALTWSYNKWEGWRKDFDV